MSRTIEANNGYSTGSEEWTDAIPDIPMMDGETLAISFVVKVESETPFEKTEKIARLHNDDTGTVVAEFDCEDMPDDGGQFSIEAAFGVDEDTMFSFQCRAPNEKGKLSSTRLVAERIIPGEEIEEPKKTE